MRKILLFSVFIFFYSFSFSQLVNIEKERKQYKQGFQGSISFQLSIIQNTNQIIQGANTAHLQFTKAKSTFLILNDYSIMKVQKDQNNYDLINQNFQHIRYNFSIIDTNKLNLELFFQRQQNKIKYLQFRFLAGTGFRVRIIHSSVVGLYFAPLLMYENEILTDSLKTTSKMLKGDFYCSLNIKLTENLFFTNATYYQPAFSNLNNFADFERFKDYRIFSESSLSIKIFKKLEFNIVFELAYDSRPPLELVSRPLFYNLTNQLTYKF